ncbi:MAG: hypothetical protein Q8P24_02250 [Desulfobacterales bacterium]|nr:hypothetical protein [Desulfobacterales bacterium]
MNQTEVNRFNELYQRGIHHFYDIGSLFLASLQAKDLARLKESALPIQPSAASHSKKDICLY